jgi:hypothetical protein
VKAGATVKATGAKPSAHAPPKLASHSESSESESEDDNEVIKSIGFDNFCDQNLGPAVHKSWSMKIIGMLEIAYENDEITSDYLKFICFSVSKCKTEAKAKNIVIE